MYSAVNVPGVGVCYVENPPPGENYKLKNNWYEFSGNEQWELNVLAQKIAAINTEWETTIPKPLRNQFLVHYGDIAKSLEENKPLEAIEYLETLSPLIPVTHQDLLTGIINKIKEEFNLQGE